MLRRVHTALRACPSLSCSCIPPALDITARPMSSVRPSSSALHVSFDGGVCTRPTRFAPWQLRDQQKRRDVRRCGDARNRRTRPRTPPRFRLDACQAPAPSREATKVDEIGLGWCASMNTGGEDGGGCLGQPHANATMEGRQGSKEHTNACTIHGNVAWKTTTDAYSTRATSLQLAVSCVHMCVKFCPSRQADGNW